VCADQDSLRLGRLRRSRLGSQARKKKSSGDANARK
jgi:hypothetical protein